MTTMKKILLIDDEEQWLRSLRMTLAQGEVAGYSDIFTARSQEEAEQVLNREKISLVLLDLMMGNVSGVDILKQFKKKYPALNIVIMTGVSTIQSAVDCINLGATEYLIKTMKVSELTLSIARMLESSESREEVSPASNEGFESFITTSGEMFSRFKYLSAVALTDEPVLITGESGVGKGIIAKCIAGLSRPGRQFIAVNVSGLDSQMFSDTLFGHVKGAYTGADNARLGAVQQVGDGVLFLDEIGDLPVPSQLKLLELTQNGTYRPLGSDTVMTSNARLLFATNQDLKAKMEEGGFRQDLYYRLTTHGVHIPPLRERSEDIPLQIRHYVEKTYKSFKKPVPEIHENIMMLMQSYDFPGNTRQLRAIIYDIAAKTDREMLTVADFIKYIPEERQNEPGLPRFEGNTLPRLEDVVNELIEKALEMSGGNQTKAAAMIGLSQSALSKRLKKKKHQ